jgi:hypothetical protein
MSKRYLVISIVNRNDRKFQRAVFSHGAQSNHAGGSLFHAAEYMRDKLMIFFVNDRNQIGRRRPLSLRLVRNGRVNVFIIGLVIFAFNRKTGTPYSFTSAAVTSSCVESGLGAHDNIAPPALRAQQIRCFRGHMQTGR